MVQHTPKLGRRVQPPSNGTPSAAGMLWLRASSRQLLPQLPRQLLQQLLPHLSHPNGPAIGPPLLCSQSGPLLLLSPHQQLRPLWPLGYPQMDQQAGGWMWRQGALWWELLVLMSLSCIALKAPPCSPSRQMPFRQAARLLPQRIVSPDLQERKRRQRRSGGDPRLPQRVRNRVLRQRILNQTRPTPASVSQALALVQ